MSSSSNISFVIPIYRVERYLDACVESALQACTLGDEIILVDDGSPDRSGEMADTWAQRHPECIRVIHQENAGLSAARNTGQAASRCPYVLFLDSDDVLEPTSFPAVREQLVDFRPDILVCDFIWWHDNDGGKEVRSARLRHPALTPLRDKVSNCRHTLQDGLLSACTRIYAKSLLQSFGPNVFPVGVAYEEVATVPRLTWQARSLVYLPKPVIKYRMRAGSITHTPTLKHCLDRSAALSVHALELRSAAVSQDLLAICDFRQAHQFVMAIRDCAMLEPQIPSLYRELLERLLSNMNLPLEHAIEAAPDATNRDIRKVIRHLKCIRRSPSVYLMMRRIGSSYSRHKAARKARRAKHS